MLLGGRAIDSRKELEDWYDIRPSSTSTFAFSDSDRSSTPINVGALSSASSTQSPIVHAHTLTQSPLTRFSQSFVAAPSCSSLQGGDDVFVYESDDNIVYESD